MIVGEVSSDGDALARLTVQGPGGVERSVEAVVDTGFNGSLALPASLIRVLGLKNRGDAVVQLASGEKRRVSTYRATVTFSGEVRPVIVVEAGEPLVGAAMLWGYALRIEYAAGGRVLVEALPAVRR